ncbi:MAG: hypothetical protein AAF844_21005 [Pseudomonadota bacterium]
MTALRLLTRITSITLGVLCILPGFFVIRSAGLEHGFETLATQRWWLLMAAACVVMALGFNLISLRAVSLSILRHRSGMWARLFCLVLGIAVFLAGLFGIYVFSQPAILRDYVQVYALAVLGFLLLYMLLFVAPGPYVSSLRRLSGDGPMRDAVIEHLKGDRIAGRGAKLANLLIGVLFILLLVPAAAGVYADRAAQFVPTDAMIDFGTQFGPVLGAGMTVLTVVLVLLRRRAEASRRTGTRPMSAWAAMLFVALFGGSYVVFGGYVLSHGLPAVHARLVEGEPGTLRMTVIEKEPVRARQRCSASVIARGEGYGGPDGRRLCSLPFALHERVRVGDVLQLEGRRTAFGLRFERVTN